MPKLVNTCSQITGISMTVSTLATKATRGGGPPFQRNNSMPLYPVDELDRWAHEQQAS